MLVNEDMEPLLKPKLKPMAEEMINLVTANAATM